MLDVNKVNNDSGKAYRIKLFSLIVFEFGMHDINGIHISAGFGVGPVELSFTLHNWDKW